MHPNKSMKRVVNGKRYNVATATLIASDEYWDGNNWERQGRNTFLYRTRGGAFFTTRLSMWEGERDLLVPVDEDEAKRLYENDLPEHLMGYEDAFNCIVEEAAAGRPPLYNGKSMKQTQIWLTDDMIVWLKSQGKPMTETIRDLIQQVMG